MKTILIGAGIGGIATAIYLARKGFDVTILEKNSFSGGRCGKIVRDGHRFDLGATLLMMPDVFKKTFSNFGKDFYKEVDLYRMEPIYKVFFPGEEDLILTSDLHKMRKQLERLEPGSYMKFLKYFRYSYDAYHQCMKHLIDCSYSKLFSFSNLLRIYLLYKYKAFKNHYKLTSTYFDNEMLRTIFAFQNLYLGQNPFKASAIFAMIPFMELSDGVYFPKGGMYQIVERLRSIAMEYGVRIILNSPVKKIITDTDRVSEAITEKNLSYGADIIISNADLSYVYNNLLPKNKMVKKLNKFEYTCSAFAFHWGVNKNYPQLEQHNVFISKNYTENFKTIFNTKSLPDDVTFYVHSPVKSDKTAAPPGQDSVTAITHTGHIQNNGSQDYFLQKSKAREAIMKRFAEEGITDFEKHVKFEVCYTPRKWESVFNLTRGATFGSISHNITQMGCFRPGNRHKKYKNLFFVGGCTHPGNGLPMSLISASLTSERVLKQYSI